MSEKKGQKTYLAVRIVTALILLVFVCLAWYGAEMLLYGYSQPSIVDAIVAVWLVTLISGRMVREMIINDRKQEFAKGFLEGLAKTKKTTDGKTEK